jgi:hypothetical protein
LGEHCGADNCDLCSGHRDISAELTVRAELIRLLGKASGR